MRATADPSPRDRFLRATETILRETGMHGAGIKEVVARSGAPIGSLYHYFPGGKTQLVGEALSIHARRVPGLIERHFDGRHSAAAAVRTLFDTAADVFEQIGASKGCAVGAVALDLQSEDAELRTICHEAFEAWAADLAPRLPFRDERTRRSFAVMIVVALEGAFVLSRVAKDGQAFREAGKWLSATLSAAEPKTARRRVRTPKP